MKCKIVKVLRMESGTPGDSTLRVSAPTSLNSDRKAFISSSTIGRTKKEPRKKGQLKPRHPVTRDITGEYRGHGRGITLLYQIISPRGWGQ